MDIFEIVYQSRFETVSSYINFYLFVFVRYYYNRHFIIMPRNYILIFDRRLIYV